MSERHSNGRRAPAPASSPAVSDRNDDVSADELPGEATLEPGNDGSLHKKPKSPRRRKKFGQVRRKEVAEVRRVGACHRCRKKKVACRHALEYALEVSSAGTQWAPIDGDQRSSDISLHSDLTIPQNRLVQLEQVGRWTDIVDGRAGTPTASTSLPNSPHMYPLNTNLNPLYPSPELFSPDLSSTNAPSVSNHHHEDAWYWCYEERCGPRAFAQQHELRLHQAVVHPELYQHHQHLHESPLDELHHDHLLSQDLAPMEWQDADLGLGASPSPAAHLTGPEMEMQMGKRARVELFINGSYHPGMDEGTVRPTSRPNLHQENMAQISHQLERMRTSSRAAASVSGRSQARVHKESLRRRTIPTPRRCDHVHAMGHGRQWSQPQQSSIPEPTYGPGSHGRDATITAQPPPMVPPEPSQYRVGDRPSAVGSRHSFPPPQAYPPSTRPWLHYPADAMHQGPPAMCVTEHVVSQPLAGWPSQTLFSTSPPGLGWNSSPVDEGYLPMAEQASFGQAPAGMPTPLQLPYELRSMIPDSDFGDPPASHHSVPSHLQPRSYHANGASFGRHHGDQPSIAINNEVVHAPGQTFHLDRVSPQEAGSSNALSFPPLDYSPSYNGSVSSGGNDSIPSVIHPLRAAQQNLATAPIDMGGAGRHADGSHGPRYLSGAGLNPKLVSATVTASEVEVQDDNLSPSGGFDEFDYIFRSSEW